MYTYQTLNELDKLKKSTSIIEAKDNSLPTEKHYTDEENAKINNVSVPILNDGKYRKSSDDEKMIGSSGNKPEEDKKQDGYPQMELGLGLNIKKEFSRTESFDGPIDEEPMETASDKKQENVIEKITDLFNEMYGKPYQEVSKEKNKKFTYDFTQPSVILNNNVGIKIKRGW